MSRAPVAPSAGHMVREGRASLTARSGSSAGRPGARPGTARRTRPGRSGRAGDWVIRLHRAGLDGVQRAAGCPTPMTVTRDPVARDWASVVRTSRRDLLAVVQGERDVAQRLDQRAAGAGADHQRRHQHPRPRAPAAGRSAAAWPPPARCRTGPRAFSRWISVLAGSAISPSATTQAVVMRSPALVALDSTRASSGICWTNRSGRRSRDRRSQPRSSEPPASPTTPNAGASSGQQRTAASRRPAAARGEDHDRRVGDAGQHELALQPAGRAGCG